MIKYSIHNRFTGALQFTAEIDCSEGQEISVKLGLSVKWAIKTSTNLGGADLGRADLRGAYLRGAYLGGAYLGGADLRGAYLRGADLRSANLRGADLRGADLGNANLVGAYLGDADLGNQWIIQGAIRSDGYAFFLQKLKDDSEPMVKAGCRYFTIAEAQAHWEITRAGQLLLIETEAIVRCMIAMARTRGLM